MFAFYSERTFSPPFGVRQLLEEGLFNEEEEEEEEVKIILHTQIQKRQIKQFLVENSWPKKSVNRNLSTSSDRIKFVNPVSFLEVDPLKIN